jgi:hypothetical protein
MKSSLIDCTRGSGIWILHGRVNPCCTETPGASCAFPQGVGLVLANRCRVLGYIGGRGWFSAKRLTSIDPRRRSKCAASGGGGVLRMNADRASGLRYNGSSGALGGVVENSTARGNTG